MNETTFDVSRVEPGRRSQRRPSYGIPSQDRARGRNKSTVR